MRRDIAQTAIHALERQRVAHIGRVKQAPISHLRGLAGLPLGLRWREREQVSDRLMFPKRAGTGTYSHVRRKVGHAIERICVVGLQGRTPFRRCIYRLALDHRKAVLLEGYRGVKPAADGNIQTTECGGQGGGGGVEGVGNCSSAFRVKKAQDCEEERKESTTRNGHG